MAINRAPFNALVDDTGTGLTGTVWGKDDIKDVLLDPIDAMITYGTWTPGNDSGLGFGGSTAGQYARYDKVVYIWCQLFFPVTGSGAAVTIAGLPVTVGFQTGLLQGFGPAGINWYVPTGGTICTPYTTAGAPATYAGLSGANVILAGVYKST